MKTHFLSNCGKNFKDFFEWTTDYLHENNKKVKIVNKENVIFEGSECSGWCDDNEIVVALKNPLFEQVYCHEFSHMTQVVENSPVWKNNYKFWDDIKNKKFDKLNWDSVMEVIELERDCEIRSMKFSKKWDLFNNEVYARFANLYLYYYQYVFLTKTWVDSTSIYHPMLIDIMPTKIQSLQKFNLINMPLMTLYNECLHKKGKFYKKA